MNTKTNTKTSAVQKFVAGNPEVRRLLAEENRFRWGSPPEACSTCGSKSVERGLGPKELSGATDFYQGPCEDHCNKATVRRDQRMLAKLRKEGSIPPKPLTGVDLREVNIKKIAKHYVITTKNAREMVRRNKFVVISKRGRKHSMQVYTSEATMVRDLKKMVSDQTIKPLKAFALDKRTISFSEKKNDVVVEVKVNPW